MRFLNHFRKESNTKRFLRKKTRCWGRNIKLGDKSYGKLQRADVTTFLEWDLTDKRQYTKEKFDCENFALSTMCNAQSYFINNFDINPPFGMCWVSGPEGMHAINFYVHESHDTVVYIEPQTDEEYFLKREKVRFLLM
jgi:hypothetical protein